MGKLKLYLRQLPVYASDGLTLIHYAGSNPQDLQSVAGPVPAVRQWPGYPDFIDCTTDAGDLQKFWKPAFSVQRNDTGLPTPGAFQPKKASNGTLQIEGDSFELIRKWLITDISSGRNAIEVKLVDEGCGEYRDFIIKSRDIRWCEGDVCAIDVVVKQKDEQLTCIQNTLIADNWQGWYQRVPANGKKHPRFSYCNEVRPNGILVLDWFNAATNGVVTALLMVSLLPLINSIIAIILAIEAILNAIPGVNVDWDIDFINPSDLLSNFQQYFIESAGCGREHPASLIRDFITNVCDKCGIQVDEESAPIFFARTLKVESSDRGEIEIANNPYYNACVLYAPVKRGIRRFKRLGIGADPNDTDFWIEDNSPLLTLDQFLDQIKGAFNHEWQVRNGRLYFQRKDFYLSENYVYDFSFGSADRYKIVEGICYEPNDIKYPASCTGIYTPDASDTCGNEAGNSNGRGQMNGYVSFADTDNNPNFEGVLNKTVQLGATKFRLDGASTDYIADAMQVVCNGSVLTPFLNGLFRDFVAPGISKYADHALLLSAETAVQPKILIWDGRDYLNAKAIRNRAAYPNVAAEDIPEQNPAYNAPTPYLPQPWHVRHKPETDILGSALTIGPNDPGRYKVTDYFSIVIYNPPAMLPNYPMYFEPWYRDNLWDYFHWIDDPRRNPSMSRNWRVKIQLCCEDLQKLGVFNDAGGIVLGQKIKLPTGFYPDGVILEITVNYDPSDTYGPHIELRGRQ